MEKNLLINAPLNPPKDKGIYQRIVPADQLHKKISLLRRTTSRPRRMSAVTAAFGSKSDIGLPGADMDIGRLRRPPTSDAQSAPAPAPLVPKNVLKNATTLGFICWRAFKTGAEHPTRQPF
jgi:hypothetical protein